MRFGVEREDLLARRLGGRRVALVMNQASAAQDGRSSLEIVRRFADVEALLALEHGIRGTIGAGEDVPSEAEVDGVPAFSLYHGAGTGLPEALPGGIDTIVYDVQDLGLRFFTYVASLRSLVEDCARTGLDLVVLDRPCPFGRHVWGNILPRDSFSFVGPDALPVSYGLTPGEAALWFAGNLGRKPPVVVPLEGWSGEPYWEKGWRWIPTSPNIPDFETAFLYAGLCLLEGTNISEGRGTCRPFKLLGAPFVEPRKLLLELERHGLEGFLFKEASFVPSSGKHQGVLCRGIEVRVADYGAAEPLKLGLAVVGACFGLFAQTRELPGSGGLSRMDRLAGKGALKDIEADPAGLYEKWQKEAASFAAERIY